MFFFYWVLGAVVTPFPCVVAFLLPLPLKLLPSSWSFVVVVVFSLCTAVLRSMLLCCLLEWLPPLLPCYLCFGLLSAAADVCDIPLLPLCYVLINIAFALSLPFPVMLRVLALLLLSLLRVWLLPLGLPPLHVG